MIQLLNRLSEKINEWIIILLFLFLNNTGYAQHLGYKSYKVEDGLAQSEIVKLFQDSRGFLWIGTKFGTSCFDGNQFKTQFDKLNVLKSTTRYISELADHSVIVTGYSGYAVFPTDGTLISYKYPVADISKKEPVFWNDGANVYTCFSTNNGLVIYQNNRDGIVDVTKSKKELVNTLNKLKYKHFTFDQQHKCYYIFNSDFELFYFRDGVSTKIDIPKLPIYNRGKDGFLYMIAQSEVRGAHNLKKENSLAEPNYSAQFLIYRMKGLQNEIVLKFNSDDPIEIPGFAVDSEGKISVFDRTHRRIHFYKNNKHTTAVLNICGLSSMFYDSENNLWMGTTNGLFRVFNENFINYDESEGLFPNIQSLLTDRNGTIWAGSYEMGLQYLKNGNFRSADSKNPDDPKQKININPGAITDQSGRMHFCLYPYSSAWIRDVSDKLHFDPSFPISSSYCVFDDTASERFLYGNNLGLIEKGYKQNDVTIHEVFPGNTSTGKIVSIVKTIDGKFLLGGFKGFLMYDNKTFRKLPDEQHKDIPGANCMIRDYKNNIWIGNGNGLYHYNNKTFTKINNGYFNNLILSLQCIGNEQLLIGGIGGIGILDLRKYYNSGEIIIRYFDKNNGFIGGECQQNCITTDKEGFVWIGASNGLVRLDTEFIFTKQRAPKIYLTHIYSNNDRMDWKELNSKDFAHGETRLNYNRNHLKFEFTAIFFNSPENLKFSYKLEGFDKFWTPATRERTASYRNLPPGTYTFKVRACNDTGVWSEKTADFRILIRAVFWKTWYFYLLMIILITTLVIISVSHYLARRTRLMREHLEYERNFAELQFKTLRNQLAPHFVFNALNAIGSSIYQNDKETSYDFLQRFAILIRATLLNADKSYRSLKEEIDFVQNYLSLEQFRFENKFDFEIQVEEGINPDLAVPKMIIQTFAENSIKHGLVQKKGRGLLTISISKTSDFLSISIKDNGIGRAEALKYNTNSTGKGMEIIQEFITLFNRFNEKKIEFEISDIPDLLNRTAGTLVVVKLPTDFTYNSKITES